MMDNKDELMFFAGMAPGIMMGLALVAAWWLVVRDDGGWLHLERQRK